MSSKFKATGVVKFTRTEVKTYRNWWQRFLKWWRKEVDIPVYHYEVEIHTDYMGVYPSDVVLMRGSDTKLGVLWTLSTIKMRTLFPTPTWLTFSDFKNAEYVIIGRSFQEGR